MTADATLDEPSVLIVDACQFTPPYNYCLMDALVRGGSQVHYATTEFAHGDALEPDGVHVSKGFFFLARVAGKVSKSAALRRFLRAVEYPIDCVWLFSLIVAKNLRIIHFMWVVAPAYDALLMRLLKRCGRRIVLTAHNPFPHDHDAGDIEKYCRVYREADRIIALTAHSKRQIVEHVPEAAERVTVIAHGDYGPLFSRTGFNESLFSQVKQKAGRKRVLSFLGGIRPYKGLEVLIEALPLIRALGDDYFFLIAGSVVEPRERPGWSRVTEALAGDDVWCDIRFLPTEDFKAYLEVTDVLIQPYLSASQSGNTVMAYAAGKPVISTDVGGLREMTEDGRTGYVVPPNDPCAIAAAVGKCFEPGRYESLSEAARRNAREKYSWTTIARQTQHVYRSIEIDRATDPGE
jgi:glycosyltransferase involved in cell wall biosynthesis